MAKIVLNTSIHVDKSVEQEFLDWLRHEFVLWLRDDSQFRPLSFSRLLLTVEEGLVSYAVRVEAPGMTLDEALARWEAALSAERLGAMSRHVGNKILFFTTPMEDFEL